ncbi:S8 family serine peptidase [Nonomuraea sp. NPDC050783]|uniref:S8 family peptidase n=1 Tax=Nonomuraea sp. NPDC050783 TaxID=3154634 RepID=UPI0034664910
MDEVFAAQFQLVQRAFAEDGIQVEAALAPGGRVDYVYRAGRLLTRNRGRNMEQISRLLPGVVREDRPALGDLAVLSIERVEGGSLTVPEALDLLEERLGDDDPARRGEPPLATPDHIVSIARLCPATEPERPGTDPAGPWPAPRPPAEGAHPVLLGVADTGLLEGPLPGWLDGVRGDPDALGPLLPDGKRHRIPPFTGHGTFAAGVARCMAPQAEVYVADHFSRSGGEIESEIVARLDALARMSPALVNLSAGLYTRGDSTSLGFEAFHDAHPGLVMVAAAGNDSTDRPFYPAAYPWTVSVGALGPDGAHRAWFSNYGDWVNVYALGEGMVNAYAHGQYTYQEPPKAPAVQDFTGMCRWDGTSFAAPLVAGLIAEHLARHGGSPQDARDAVLAGAVPVAGVGPVLTP